MLNFGTFSVNIWRSTSQVPDFSLTYADARAVTEGQEGGVRLVIVTDEPIRVEELRWGVVLGVHVQSSHGDDSERALVQDDVRVRDRVGDGTLPYQWGHHRVHPLGLCAHNTFTKYHRFRSSLEGWIAGQFTPSPYFTVTKGGFLSFIFYSLALSFVQKSISLLNSVLEHVFDAAMEPKLPTQSHGHTLRKP